MFLVLNILIFPGLQRSLFCSKPIGEMTNVSYKSWQVPLQKGTILGCGKEVEGKESSNML